MVVILKMAKSHKGQRGGLGDLSELSYFHLIAKTSFLETSEQLPVDSLS